MDKYMNKKDVVSYIRKEATEAQKAFDELGGESGIIAQAFNDLANDFSQGAVKYVTAAEAFAQIPAAPVPQWISVKDKLPEPGELVLIWYEYFRYGDYNRMYKIYGLGYQYEGFWSGVDPLGDKARVLAWMPLPTPYVEDRNG